MGGIQFGPKGPQWVNIGQGIKDTFSTYNPPAPTFAGVPALPGNQPDINDVALKEASLQGLNQRMQASQLGKFALGDPSQTPIGTKTLLGQ